MDNNKKPKSNDAFENEEFETTHIVKEDNKPSHTKRNDEEN